jgi:hypothetical protein
VDAFKPEFAKTGELDRYDNTISTLHQFEELPYPDNMLKHGAKIEVEWESSSSNTKISPSVYLLYVNDLDHLVGEIFRVCSRDPSVFTWDLSSVSHARDIIMWRNAVGPQLLPS